MPRKKKLQEVGGLRLVAYYRYSNGGQQTEQSIEGQRRDCEAYAKAHGYKIVHEYIDRHISGKSDSRPAFQQMISDSDSHLFDAVICWKTDRLARSRYDSIIYKTRLRKNGVKILYAAETVVDGPEGIIIEGLMESLAEYYSAELAQKLRRGQRESALKCIALGGNRSFGYDIGPDKHYCINEKQAPAVRYIFEQYAAGATAADIVRELTARGYRTSRGNPFNKNSICRIITNEMYLGVYKYADIRIEGGVPAMIDRELFNRCQTQLAFNRAHGGGKGAPRADYVLVGKLDCGLCGHAMKGASATGHTGSKHYYYTCTQHVEKKCPKTSIEKNYLEQIIVDGVAKYVLTPEKISQIVDCMMELQAKEQEPKGNPERDALEAELAECRRKQNNILDAIEEGGSARLAARLRALEEQEAQLTFALGEINNAPAPPQFSREALTFMFEQFRREEDEVDEEYRRRILDTFVSSILLYEDRAEVKFNITDQKTGDFERVILPISANKKPPEDDDTTSNSEGSTALRLVEAMGVEPMSEKSSVQVSPGAGDLQHSRRATPIVRLALW